MFRRVKDHWDDSVSSVGVTLTIVGYLWAIAMAVALVWWVFTWGDPIPVGHEW